MTLCVRGNERHWRILTYTRPMKSGTRTYLEGAVVRMMWMMKLRCVNHVAGLGILALGWLRDLGVTRGGDARVVLCSRGILDCVLFLLLLHFRLRFLMINLLYNNLSMRAMASPRTGSRNTKYSNKFIFCAPTTKGRNYNFIKKITRDLTKKRLSEIFTI